MEETKKKQKYTEARKEGNRRWDAANLDRLSIALKKGEKEKIKAFSDQQGLSINAFIQNAVQAAMNGQSADTATPSSSACSSAGAVDIDLATIDEHIKRTGDVSARAFIDRAIKNEIDRDNLTLMLGVKPIIAPKE